MFPSVFVRYTNRNKPKLIYLIHSRKVSHWTSRMPGDYPIISSGIFLVLQFDSQFFCMLFKLRV